MDLEKLRLAYETPRHLSPVSAWVEHIPFAMALIDLARPVTLVELGTHMGDSYCAFCQAIDTLKLETTCLAIDSWTGDEQAGHYGREVLRTLRAHHDPLYGRFSRLLRTTFDQALAKVPDQTVDLLHIDGLHTYDAVRHDFAQWLPKLSARGIVLLHDTQVRHGDFGVWKLWQELARQYPSFEFTHGYGLGLLAVGAQVPAGVAEFIAWANTPESTASTLFAALGNRWRLAQRMLAPPEQLQPLAPASPECPSLSVVIPTYNAGPRFDALLRGLASQSYAGPRDLLIIDSGSSDDTIPRAQAAGATVLCIPHDTFNHGLTRQHAISASTGDLVVLMTQDAVPADDLLLAHLAAPFADPRVAGTFARQLPRPEHDALIARRVRESFAGSATRRVCEMTDRPMYRNLTSFDRYRLCAFDSVCCALRRSAWREIPFLKSDFGEDLEWSTRALEASWKIIYEPTARVLHSHDRSARYEYRRTYMGHRALFRLFGLNAIPRHRRLLPCICRMIIRDAATICRHQPGLVRKLSRLARIPAHAAASVMGQYHGVRDEQRGHGRRKAGV